MFNIHIRSVVVDFLIHPRLDLLDRHLRRQTNVKLLPLRNVEILHVSNFVENGMLDSFVDGHALSWIKDQ
jgi:hypothetical protein